MNNKQYYCILILQELERKAAELQRKEHELQRMQFGGTEQEGCKAFFSQVHFGCWKTLAHTIYRSLRPEHTR